MPREFDPDDPWSSLVINQVKDPHGFVIGYILVRDPSKHDPKWKLPGGHKEPGETPLQTAMRENQGETGLRLPQEAFRAIPQGTQWLNKREPHWSFLFIAHVPEADVKLMHGHDIGNEGEEARYFSNAEIEQLVREEKILYVHWVKMQIVMEQFAK